jgi:RNA polymerase sigma factor (sigma-70 family)
MDSKQKGECKLLYRDQTDETLVMLTLAGEQAAYEALVLRYQRAVTASALSVTHNSYMAEDAAQDAFVTAWIKLDTLQQPSKFAVWACRIAKNCARNMIARYRSFLPLEELENLDLTDEQNENPAELYARDEESQMLHQTVNALPQKVGTVIRLHYFEGLSVSEIAERMHTSAGTVK